MSGSSPQDIEAQIAQTRAELRATVDELSERLSPRNQATEALDDVKLVVADLKRRVTGDTKPEGEPEPGRRGWIVLGAGALVALTVVRKIARLRR